MTRAGRVSRPSEKYVMATMALTHAEMGYHANLKEIAMMEYLLDFEVTGVGTGLGGGFTHTHELKAMKYEEAMAADQEGWVKAVEE
eukprot:4574962-Ditylum_brightwellii.AAC.1